MYRILTPITIIAGFVLMPVVAGAAPVGATTVVLAPLADAYLYSTTPTTNYGTDSGLASGSLVSGNTLHLWTSLLKFDLSTIPDEGVIIAATLYMYQVNGAGYTRTVGTNLSHLADDTWGETTVTWNNQPAAGALLDTCPDTADHRGWSQWYLLATGNWNRAADQADNLLSLLVTEVPASSSHNWNSREFTGDVQLRPYLEVIYVPEPVAVMTLGIMLAFMPLRRHMTMRGRIA